MREQSYMREWREAAVFDKSLPATGTFEVDAIAFNLPAGTTLFPYG
ncbi:hypothetical protein [Microcoleus sp. FACHB-672]|nr:hypothetical protein [Microcoleus sp. FACHB-672]MBD2043169.1 hypothetical protein [Microcoleus sp. FACHB-672]